MSEGIKRRDFLKVLGVGGAGVATAGCSTGAGDKLIPYVIPPEEITPSIPTFYTSTCRECPAGCGIVVETHEGRVTKIEGNPEGPAGHAGTCARGQASVQGLYHPDRYRGPAVLDVANAAPRNLGWSEAEGQVAAQILKANAEQPGSVVFLTGAYGGTMDTLVDAFCAAAGIRRVTYAPHEDAPRDLNFADADYLVSFGADFLETWGNPGDYTWQFSRMHGYTKGRRRGKFVWVGPHRPLTGLNADQWIAPVPGTEGIVVQALAGEVSAAQAAEATGVPAAVLERLVAEYRAAANPVALGPGAALAGANATQLRAQIARLNGGATGGTAPADLRPLVQLAEQMRSGAVRVVLIDAHDPVYALPGALRFREALSRVPVRVSFSSFPDDTASRCNYHLPQSHFLESWGDYLPRPGVAALVQPAMRPVFNTKHVGDALLGIAAVMGVDATGGTGATTFYDYLRTAWAGRASGAAWREALKRGGVFSETTTTAAAPPPAVAPAAGAATVAGAAPAPAAAQPAPAPAGGGAALQRLDFEGDGAFHLVVYPSYRFFDGRTANRPWLLELPDPVTKVPWNSWVELHPETARSLGVEQGDIVRVESAHGAVESHAYVWPGVRRDTVAIQMGLGHENFGRWTAGVGINPNRLLGLTVDPATGAAAPYGQKVAVTRVGDGGSRWEGLFEQGQRIQHNRRLSQAVGYEHLVELDEAGPGEIPGRESTLKELRGYGGFKPEERTTDPAAYPPPATNYGEYIEGDTRWAMAIDLSRCTGCGACAIACQAENNLPVVGEREMKRGRELSWLRIERYFGVTQTQEEAYHDGGTDDVRFLPMLCQHCGNAPCEPVCPVYAAYHTPDGLNGQVYNRCVGTRYCANNCPYKVRVFNWFTYEFTEPLNWQLNPDVTVREKGVMEKCTFCVQRIHEKERNAALEGRLLRDGEVVPACAQACSAEVFVFGNIQDETSAVAQVARSNRSYRALGEINTQPAIVYLKKVTLEEPRNGGLGQVWPPVAGAVEGGH